GALGAKLATLGSFWPHAVFLGVFLGFAVKVPLYPFHTWLPPAYAEAPTGVSMFLTGVMSKMGVYGFLRLLWPLFPGPLHAASVPLVWLALGRAERHPAPNVQSRPLGRRAVLLRRRARDPGRRPRRPWWLRRRADRGAGVRRIVRHRDVLVPRASGPQRLRRRVPDLPRRVGPRAVGGGG